MAPFCSSSRAFNKNHLLGKMKSRSIPFSTLNSLLTIALAHATRGCLLDGDLRSLASLKRKNPSLKLLVSLRPDDYFSFDLPADSSSISSQLLANETVAQGNSTASTGVLMNEMHQKFAKRIRDFIVRHSLDGINLDWPYFAQTMPDTNSSRDHLNLVLQAINENFQTSLAQSSPSSAYLRMQAPIVTLTVSKDFYSLVDVYDFHQINQWVDFVHLPAFDFDLSVDQYSIGHPARLHGISDVENLDTLVDLLLSSGLPREQLIAGLPSHGVQITSRPTTATSSQPKDESSANLDEQLEAAANISIISHAEVCRIRDLVRSNCTNPSGQVDAQSPATCWTMSRARDLTAPFAYDSEHWVGFDDENSVKLKAKYVLLRQLAGIALFNANNDDPLGQCGFGPFPLLATINSVFERAAMTQPQATAASQQKDQQLGSSSNQRTYFTRAPNQMLTATSLMSQLFGNKKHTTPALQTTPTPANDLLASASEHQDTGAGAADQQRGSSLMSFVDIIEKYGAVHRLDSAQSTADGLGPDGNVMSLDEQLPCTKVGYQRYPRDCSRFYRCVQTPPATSSPISASIGLMGQRPGLGQVGSALASSTTRLQYECPSGLVFDEPYQICNWPSWSAQCTGSGEVNSITNSKFVCPNYGYFQNQENCEYFYYCSDYQRDSHSQAYQFRCPFELGFDEEKLQCNWKWLVKGCNSTQPKSNQTNSEAENKELRQRTTTPVILQETSTMPASRTLGEESKLLDRSKRSTSEREERSIAWTSHLASIMASVDAIREHRAKKNQNQQGTSGLQVGKLKQPPKSAFGAPSSPLSESESKPAASSVTSSATLGEGLSSSMNFLRQRRRQATTSAPSSEESYSGSGLPYTRPPAPPSRFNFLPNNALYMVADSLRSVGEAIQGEVNRYLRVAGDNMRRIFGVRGGPSGVSKVDQGQSDNEKQDKLKQSAASRSDDSAAVSRNEDEANRLEHLLDELDSWISQSQQGSGADVSRRRKRTKRQVGNEGFGGESGDLDALESGPGDSWISPPAAYVKPPVYMAQQASVQHNQHQQYHQQSQRPLQSSYNDPLGRPPGYPLNKLDDLAKSAVLGPEPKLYSQPAGLVHNQLSGITQQEYDRLLKSSREAFNTQYPNNHIHNHRQNQQHHSHDNMMAAASSDVQHHHMPPPPPSEFSHEKIIGRMVEQARLVAQQQHHHLGAEYNQQLPYGMPMMVNNQQQQQHQVKGSEMKKKRPTVAMKLASLAMPKFVTMKPVAKQVEDSDAIKQQTTKAPSSGKSSGYMSFFPSLTNVVTAPARNIMSKAKDLNKAMQDLISTLAPGGGAGKNQQQVVDDHKLRNVQATTPLPMVTRLVALQPMQQQFKQLHPQPQAMLALQSSQQAPQMIVRGPEPIVQPSRVPVMQSQTSGSVPIPIGPNKTLPLYLTEEEARVLSAQLDQLSKEQLEALADGLYTGEEQPNNHRPAQQPVMEQQPSQQHPTRLQAPNHFEQTHLTTSQLKNEPQQDYVVRLLKMLSKTSKNPEDIKLLEQLAGQLNNPPPPQPGNKGRVEIVQPDDLALLEALGLLPNQRPHESGEFYHNQPQLQPDNTNVTGLEYETSSQSTEIISDVQNHNQPEDQIGHHVSGDYAGREQNFPVVSQSQSTTPPAIIYGSENAEPQAPYPGKQQPDIPQNVAPSRSPDPDVTLPPTTITTTLAEDTSAATVPVSSQLINQQYFESQVIDKQPVKQISYSVISPISNASASNIDDVSTQKPVLQEQVAPEAQFSAASSKFEQVTGGQRIKVKKRNKANISTTTSTTTGPTTAATVVESTTTAPSVVETTQMPAEPIRQQTDKFLPDDATRKRPSRVEKEFSSFMVELKRSQMTNSTSLVTEKSIVDATTSTPRPNEPSTEVKKKRKSRTGKNRQPLRQTSEPPSAATTNYEPIVDMTGSRRHKTKMSNEKWTTKASQDQYVAATYVPVNNHGFRSPSYPMLVDRGEQVAIYGTKSGFMPMITSDDASFHHHEVAKTASVVQPNEGSNQKQVAANSLGGSSSIDPMSFSASYVSNKRQQPNVMNADLDRKKETKESGRDISWNSFVRSLDDQISVVNLGNYSDQESDKLIQVKLVILPASPNNQLLEPANWQQLARYYPQLFPANLAHLSVAPIDLGPSSLIARTSTPTTSIDEPREEMRLNEFRRQFEQISKLIERKTFKALDEIVQRSRGGMFMMQRKEGDPSRTIIAVIPEKSLRRHPNRRHNKTLRQQHLQQELAIQEISSIASQNRQSAQEPSSTTTSTTTTTTSQPIKTTTTTAYSTTTAPTEAEMFNLAPRKAAAFSRAIQDQIQGAIRQHYKVIKSQLRQSMDDSQQTTASSAASASAATTTTTTTTSTTSPPLQTTTYAAVRTAGWSTPPADLMASMIETGTSQPDNSQLDPMDTASSSTEYSLARLGTNETFAALNLTAAHPAQNASTGEVYSSHSVYEVDGAESKSLYGLDLNSQQMEQELYFKSIKTPKVPQSSDDISSKVIADSTNQLRQTSTMPHAQQYNSTSQRHPSTTRPRFISIGSHLISSPMKLPKVLDQAYVNHFYDHIGDYQLAKAVGLDELIQDNQTTTEIQRNESSSGDQQEQTIRTTSNQQQQGTANLSEDSLVPETACTRAGLFQHPFACNKFYECFWDKQLSKFTLHMFECPIKLAFDDRIVGCAMPIESSLCVNY